MLSLSQLSAVEQSDESDHYLIEMLRSNANPIYTRDKPREIMIFECHEKTEKKIRVELAENGSGINTEYYLIGGTISTNERGSVPPAKVVRRGKNGRKVIMKFN